MTSTQLTVPSGGGALPAAYNLLTGSLRTQGNTALRNFRSRLSAAEAGVGLCNIVSAGTSISGGIGSSRAQAWSARLVGGLSSLGYPVAGSGFMAAGGYPADPRVTLGQWSPWNVPWSTLAQTSTGSSPLVFADPVATGTIVEVLYFDGPNAQQFTVSVDGGAAQQVNVGSTLQPKLFTIAGLAAGTHTVTVTSSPNQQTFVFGVRVRKATGVDTSNLGIGGAFSANVGPAAGYQGGPYGTSVFAETAAIMGTAGGLVVVEYGANDYDGTTGALATNLANAVSGFKALPGVDVALMAYAGQQNDVYTDDTVPPLKKGNSQGVRDVMAALSASTGVPLIDMKTRWGSYDGQNALGMYFDNIHPSAAGSSDYARAALARLEV